MEAQRFKILNVLEEVPMRQYLAMPEYSASELSEAIDKSPRKMHIHKTQKSNDNGNSSQSLLLGAAIHSAVLEPHDFLANALIEPCVDWRTKAALPAYMQWMEENGLFGLDAELQKPSDIKLVVRVLNPGKILLSTEDHELCKSVARAAWAFAPALLMKTAKKEFVVVAEHVETGLKIRIRPDFCLSDSSVVMAIDLKTCEDASFRAFMGDIYRYRYYRSYALYREILSTLFETKSVDYCLLAIEKPEPHEAVFWKMEDALLKKAIAEVEAAILAVSYCENNENWYGYGGGIGAETKTYWAV